MGADVRAALTGAAAIAQKAVQVDNEYWSELRCGQDTEEAEASGTVIGYAEAFEAAVKLVCLGDGSDLHNICEGLRTIQEQQEMELAEYRGEEAVEEAGDAVMVVKVTIGASEALMRLLVPAEDSPEDGA
jgi:hypothetical protein